MDLLMENISYLVSEAQQPSLGFFIFTFCRKALKSEKSIFFSLAISYVHSEG